MIEEVQRRLSYDAYDQRNTDYWRMKDPKHQEKLFCSVIDWLREMGYAPSYVHAVLVDRYAAGESFRERFMKKKKDS